jgi:hypothetical protein
MLATPFQAVVDRHHAGVGRVAKEIAGEAAAEQAAIPLNPTNTAQLTSADQQRNRLHSVDQQIQHLQCGRVGPVRVLE